MPNWAIVIGVDKYAASSLNLKGAVRDALGMAEFLTSGESPLVEPARLKLLLSPTAESPKAPPSLAAVPVLDASLENIVDAVRDVAKKPSGRLFVHFSGHGLMAPGVTGGEAILPTDYKPSLPVLSIRLDGIRDFLRTSKFDEQIFFIDACRNTPLPDHFNIGQFPDTPEPKDMRPQVQQFVFCATLRGATAAEDRRTANDERGVFTTPLLRGLRGEGRAKFFDEEQQLYVVTTGRLLRFVKEQVRRTLGELEAPASAQVQKLQEPRLIGEIADTETVILSLPPTGVPAVHLRFDLTPPEAAAIAKAVVSGEDSTEVGPPIGHDTAVPLPPRDYRVQVRADGFVSEKKSWRTELYEDTRLSLLMKPGIAAPERLTRSARAAAAPGSLELSSTDPLTIVQIVDERGTLLASGKEKVSVRQLKPGIYHGKLVSPDGTLIEQAIDIDEGASERVKVQAPPPRRLLTSNATPSRGRKTPAIDVMAVDETSCRSISAGVQPLDGGETVFTPAPLPSPGHYVLSLDVDGLPVNLALPAIEGWTTTLVVDRSQDRQKFSSVQLLKAGGSNIGDMGRVETAQRYFQNGLFDASADLIAGQVEGPMALMLEAYALLRLTLMGRGVPADRGKVIKRRLQQKAARLWTDFPSVSDWALLQAELTPLPLGHDSAARHCKAALDLGLPVFAFGTLRLMQLVDSLNVEHPRRPLLERAATNRLTGWLWTAWSDPPAATTSG